MATKQGQGKGMAHVASAQMRSLPISTKHSIEISRHLRFKTCASAKSFLEDVITLSKPVPFKRFTRDIGHKSGMSSGRYPVKAAKAFLTLVKSVEKNAEDIGLDSSSLKIVHLLANKASIPMTGGRTKGATKRTHLEIKVAEVAAKTKGVAKPSVKSKKSTEKSAAKASAGAKKPVSKKPASVASGSVAREEKVPAANIQEMSGSQSNEATKAGESQ